MNCPHCGGECTIVAGEDIIPASPADVEIARLNNEHAERMALIERGIDPDRKGAAGSFKPLPEVEPDTSHAEVYAEAEVAVAEAEADATVAAAAVVGEAIEAAAVVVGAAAEAVAEIVTDDDDSEALDDDATVVLETSTEDEDASPPRGSIASRLFG